MHIALFGGAFDPPHLGHQQVAVNLVEEKIVDQVWFVPVFQHPWAKELHKEFLTSYDMRVEMLEYLVKDCNEKLERTQKTPQELRNESYGVLCEMKTVWKPIKIAHFREVSFTYDTLMYFSQKHPEYEFSWIMGSEYLPKFDKFLEMHPKLLDFTFYIYPRMGIPFEPLYPNMKALENMPEVNISSTQIRKQVKENATISKLVLEQTNDFISQKNLYK